MSSELVNEVRRGFYLDSVALMRLSRDIAAIDGVSDAAMMMGTPSNLRLMADAGLLQDGDADAGGGDLVIAIAANGSQVAANALEQARVLLDQPTLGKRAEDKTWRPRTIDSAIKAMPEANLALISVAGEYAPAEARRALQRGLHVMIFSDNVSIEEEVMLKQQARDLGLLLMGPDCGTAVINGVPLAFANALPRGNIGIIGASGTGIQEVTCLIAHGGGGISHAIGVGGRDLSKPVGGITTMMALDALDDDPHSEHVVLISKPPAPEVAARVVDRVAASGKTFTLCFIGSDGFTLPDNARFANTLKAAAESALSNAGLNLPETPTPSRPVSPAQGTYIRGLFSGGSLCAEAQVVLLAGGASVSSNVPIAGASASMTAGAGHLLLDLGSDEYTRGRPHPMIDPAVRDDAIVEALQAPGVGVILLDLVLGYGAHDDPAQHLHNLLGSQRTTHAPQLVASVTGTDDDPQSRAKQTEILKSAGVTVLPSNADAAAFALARAGLIPSAS